MTPLHLNICIEAVSRLHLYLNLISIDKKHHLVCIIFSFVASAGVSISDQKWDHKVLDSAQIYNEQLFMYIQNLNNDIIRMQRLMVDYYTNELVDTIDCRLQ